ncbi:hypothetical protein [Stenotrophomonas maltophilia]|uniref:hypothetical protein n=1 Tax=Stenotrophomonas maltophilia TaxID=40324 RepID=UPI002115246C|nr:hypothetical protein [Stenotrophomonas maltophilia]
MAVAWARVVEGSETRADDGIYGALRCVIETDDGALLAAVLKRDSPELVFAEALCSILLSKWGLTVPQPFLVRESGQISFASADVGYPNLKKRVGLGPEFEQSVDQGAALRLAATLVASFPTTPLAAAIDEAIDNRDRNLGNVLWDGNEEAWIDHALALGNGLHMPDTNKLCMLMTIAGKADEALHAAISRWTAMNRSVVAAAAGEIANVYDATHWQQLITERLDDLGTRITNRFPKPNDLLADLQ